jgi:Flp pilus assembly protein protease CpaA
MAILKLLLALLLVGAVITITLLVYRTYKARNGAAAKEHQSQAYVASVPGGSY